MSERDYIPDPLEILESQFDRLEAQVDADETIPCAGCGKRTPLDECYPASAHPAAPPVCTDCMNKAISEWENTGGGK